MDWIMNKTLIEHEQDSVGIWINDCLPFTHVLWEFFDFINFDFIYYKFVIIFVFIKVKTDITNNQ